MSASGVVGPKRTALVTMALLVMLGDACSREKSRKPLTPGLIVLPGAMNVRATIENEGTVVYELSEPYPAVNTIAALGSNLGTLGWRAMDRDVMNPSISTSFSRGWDEFLDSSGNGPPRETYQWIGQWEDRTSRNVAWYTLTYDASVDANGRIRARGPLRVMGTIISAKAIRMMRGS